MSRTPENTILIQRYKSIEKGQRKTRKVISSKVTLRSEAPELAVYATGERAKDVAAFKTALKSQNKGQNRLLKRLKWIHDEKLITMAKEGSC